MINEPIKTETPPLTPRECKLMDSLTRQNDLICNLKQSLTAAEKDNKRLHEEIEMLRSDNETYRRMLTEMQDETEIAQMFRVLEEYVRDDVDMQDIGRAVVSYVDLLDRKAVERNA